MLDWIQTHYKTCIFRSQLLWLRVAEEVVCPEQLHILLLWERQRFGLGSDTRQTLNPSEIPSTPLSLSLQINSRRAPSTSTTTACSWWPAWGEIPRKMPVLSFSHLDDELSRFASRPHRLLADNGINVSPVNSLIDITSFEMTFWPGLSESGTFSWKKN